MSIRDRELRRPQEFPKLLSYLLRGLFIAALIALALWFIYSELSERYRFHWIIPSSFLGDFNEAFLTTLTISAVSGIFALILGLLVALARLSPIVQLRDLGALYVHTFRNIPFFVFVLIAYFGLRRAIDVRPLFESLGVGIELNIFWGIVALSIFEGAFIAEIIRAGIQSVHPSQREAARTMGLSPFQTFRLVILPQAVRNILPSLTGEMITLVKESSLLFFIAVQELTLTARQLAAHEGATLEFYSFLALYYLAITLPIAFIAHLLEKRFNPERAHRH